MRKILVVEDEDAIREVIALNLRMAGYEVAEAPSADAATAGLLADIWKSPGKLAEQACDPRWRGRVRR